MDRLGDITLRDVWQAIYHPPDTPFKTAILVLALGIHLPTLYQWWQRRSISRKVHTFSWPVPKPADLAWTSKVIKSPNISSHLVDSGLLPPEAGSTGVERDYITCFDPATGYHIETIPLLSADEVANQIKTASKAQPAWAKSTFQQRQSLLRSLKAWVLRDMDGIVKVACRDTGKTRVDAVFGEILTTLSKIDWLLKHGEKTLKPKTRPGNLLLAHKVSKVHYQPLGTVLALVSWNYSFHNLLSPILAALFAGNSVVVKCSEQVAWSSKWFIGGVKACLRASGFDDGIVQLVICLPDVAETITRNPLVKHITFIGSEPVGKKVAMTAAEIMVPTCIELGGKDPAFLLPSADLNFFASTWMRGAFQAAGQNCIGIELFLVPQSLYPRFLEIMTPRVNSLRLGPTSDVGSLISSTPIPRLQSILSDSVKSGARLLAGGEPFSHDSFPEGAYFCPTLMADVKLDMEIAKQELFAPVMTVVPYDDDQVDAIVDKLNQGRFGLGASVFGRDRAECRRVAEKLECGMVAINDFGVFYLNQAMPFGGVKASGHGRFGGEEGLRSLCFAKAISEDRFFSLIKTSIPRPVDYPLPSSEQSWNFLRGLVRLAYAPSVLQRGKGLIDLLKAL